MSLSAKLILKALETGVIPEKMTRVWIRHLCASALERASLGEVEARHAVFRQICKDMRLGTALRFRENAECQLSEPEPEFFEFFLGRRLNDCCCYFPTGAEDLDEAEDTMLWMSADRARIKDGMKILEIGCGWGAMTFWLARQFPQAHITAVTESTSRLIHLQKKLNELEIRNVRIIASEFADLDFLAEFDRVICLERMDMMAGTHDWDARISSWLKPDGKFFLQHQVHASFAYYSDSAGLEDFPGNSIVYPRLVPSAEMLMMFQQYFSVEDFWKISGDQYRMTADKWLKRFYFYRMSLMPLLEKAYGKKNAWTWLQRWRLYLLATSEKSGFNRGQEWILGQYLFSRRTGSQSFSA